ncbi:MAG TPA: pentapeptide repeat-containing protein [Candidatus Brocadiales bacterium]|nr:pentapeptide repeat-containing protein [Candidatus Brocadiales bacterium]
MWCNVGTVPLRRARSVHYFPSRKRGLRGVYSLDRTKDLSLPERVRNMERPMCNWKPKYSQYKCNEPATEGDRYGYYCILHFPHEDKNPDTFKKKVEERIESKDSIDLKGCYFPKGFDYTEIKLSFDVPVDFSEAPFSKEAYFIGATFSEGAYFTGAAFSGEAYFAQAKFSEGADFSWAAFSERAYFTGATFSEGADFFGATFSKGNFAGTTFSKGANFNNAEFRERVRFQSLGSGDEGKPVFLGPGSSFQYTRFTVDSVFQDVDLSHCSFLHSNIDKVDFRYCKFNEKTEGPFFFFSNQRKNVLRDELDADQHVILTLNEVKGKNLKSGGDSSAPQQRKPREEEYEPVRRLYQELKCNFENKKDWNTAGDFHYGEMECRRKGRLGGWLDFLLVTTYYGASGYGERPWRALSWWFFCTLLLFPLLYRLTEHDPLSACVWDSVRVATFMKIGIPIEPEGWGKLVLALQYFIGPTLLALFGLALRRKVKR